MRIGGLIAYTLEEAVHLGGRIEVVALGLAAKALAASHSKAGKASGEARRGNARKTLPTVRDEKARTHGQAASAVGMSRPTYEKAKAVVDSGDRGLIDEMNRTERRGLLKSSFAPPCGSGN